MIEWRLTLEEARRRFADRGLVLLEEEYRNNRQPLRYRCSCGREATTRLISLKSKQGPCRHCVHDQRRLSLERVRRYFTDAGCELLTDHYENMRQYLTFRCRCGRQSVITLMQFRRGSRCPDCTARRRGGERNLVGERDEGVSA